MVKIIKATERHATSPRDVPTEQPAQVADYDPVFDDNEDEVDFAFVPEPGLPEWDYSTGETIEQDTDSWVETPVEPVQTLSSLSNYFNARKVNPVVYGVSPALVSVRVPLPELRAARRKAKDTGISNELAAVRDRTLDIVGVTSKERQAFIHAFRGAIDKFRDHLVYEAAPVALSLDVAYEEAAQTLHLITGDTSIKLEKVGANKLLRQVLNLKMIDVLAEHYELDKTSTKALKAKYIAMIDQKK